MAETEEELKRIFAAYLELSRVNYENALRLFKDKCEEILESYKNKLNENSNKT